MPSWPGWASRPTFGRISRWRLSLPAELAGVRLLRSNGLDPSRRPVVGLCVTALDPALAERLVPALVAAVDAYPALDFCVIPMSRHPFVAAHNDELLGRRLQELRPRIRMLIPPDDSAQLLGVFEALGAAICVRYHSLLFAERGGIPIVPIAYAEKCRHWLAERSIADVPAEPDALIGALGAAGLAAAA